MNKLIEFLHDPEAKGLILGNNGFHAERPTSAFVGIWYEGKVICKIDDYSPNKTVWRLQERAMIKAGIRPSEPVDYSNFDWDDPKNWSQ